MACLTDFLADFMANLGRTLRSYRDRHSRTMSTEAIVAHSLYANGTEDLADLEYYMQGEIPRYGAKLGELHRKLQRSLQEAASGGGRPVADGEVDDAFMAGMAGGLAELGDDFFGFKELGLAKELGVDQLTVPQRLWKDRAAADTDAAEAEAEALPHPLPAPWAPVVGPEGHIGLLHTFIADKLQASSGADGSDAAPPAGQCAGIPEDEDIAPRSRFGAARPKAPPPNYLTHPRTHKHVGSGLPPPAAEGTGKKRPAKSTKKRVPASQ
ncbi:Transcriptional activator spt7 [Coemansia spiralis]|nr:Transcriptional activator spt7 [Coemansia spiralis]